MAQSGLRFVDVETARSSRGLRLALVTTVPSLWSDAARGMAAAKQLDCLAVAFVPGDEVIPKWTGCANVPVALYKDELPRSGWAEILSLFERLGGAMSLVPDNPTDRVAMFGLAREVGGDMGVGWIRRLLLIHASFTTDGAQGFATPVAKFLARRYGYSSDWIDPARRRLFEILRLLDEKLSHSGGPYFFGAQLTALDFYWAAALGGIMPLPDSVRPISAALRPAFEQLDDELARAITPALRAHRDRIAPRWLALPPPTA